MRAEPRVPFRSAQCTTRHELSLLGTSGLPRVHWMEVSFCQLYGPGSFESGSNPGRGYRGGSSKGIPSAQAQPSSLAPEYHTQWSQFLQELRDRAASSTSPSSSSSGGRSLFPFLLRWLPAFPGPLLQEAPGWGAPTLAEPLPPPRRASAALRPAGTRLPIPYMDKCVQAKSGIQAPDVSLQRSGHRRETEGRGWGRWGGRRGEAPTSSRSSPAKFHFLSVGLLPGPASFPGISSFSGGHSRAPQGKGWLRRRARGGLRGRCGPGPAGLGTMGGGVPGTSSSARASASSRRGRRCPVRLLPEVPCGPSFLPAASAAGAARTPGRGPRASPPARRPPPPRRITGCAPWGRGRRRGRASPRGWAGLQAAPRAPCPGFAGRLGAGPGLAAASFRGISVVTAEGA